MSRRLTLFLLVPIVSAAVVLAVPTSRDWLLGSLGGEPFHDGRPLRTWLRLLRAGDDQDRERAAQALGAMSLPADTVTTAIVPALTEGMEQTSYMVRRNAAESLGKIGTSARSAAPTLLRGLADPFDDVRWRSAQALGEIGGEAKTVAPALLEVARKDRDNRARVAAVVSIGKFGLDAAPFVPDLVEMISRPSAGDRGVAEAARKALQKIGAAAVPSLTKACKGGDARARAAAAQTLAGMGDAARPTLPALEANLTDKAVPVRVQAAVAVWKLTQESGRTAPVLAAALKDSDLDTAAVAMLALADMGPRAAVAVVALQERLGDKESGLRRIAAQTLGKIGPAAAAAQQTVERLAQEDEEPDVRQAATEAIAAIRGAKQ